MPIEKPQVKKETEVQALKLFAAGYRPIKRSLYPMIGCMDMAKLKRGGFVNPAQLKHFAGMKMYCTDIRTIKPDLYYAICRLSNQAKRDPENRVYMEMANQHATHL